MPKSDEYLEHRQKSLEVFRDHFQPDTELIYYPFCGDDPAPFKAFPEGNVLGVDIDSYRIESLAKQGLGRLVCSSVDNLQPIRPADVLLNLGINGWLNWAGDYFKPFVKPDGYIVTDSTLNLGYYMGNYKNEFRLAGIIKEDHEVETESGPSSNYTNVGYLRWQIERHQGSSVVTALRLACGRGDWSYFVIRRKMPSHQRQPSLMNIEPDAISWD